MFCQNCGAEITEGVAFCTKCGEKVVYANTVQQQSDAATETVELKKGSATKFKKQALDATVPDWLREDYDLLYESASECPRIKKITVNKIITINKKMTLQIKGFFHNFFYTRNNLIACIPSVVHGIILSLFFLFDVVFLVLFLEEGYDFTLTICFLISSILYLPYILCSFREENKIREHISKTLDGALGLSKARSFVRNVLEVVCIVIMIAKIGLGIVALVFCIDVTEIFSTDSGQAPPATYSKEASVTPKDISLNQTYTNEDEGFSFMYPDDWTVTEVPDMVITVSAPASELGIEAMIEVAVVMEDVNNDDYEELFSATMSDFETAYSFNPDNDNVRMVDLSDVSLSGYSARKMVFTCNNANGVSCSEIQYLYVVNSTAYSVFCISMESKFDKYEPIFDAIMDSYTITATETSASDADYDAAAYAYAEKVLEVAADDDTARFALIDLTGNDIPELVTEQYYTVSVYTWADGKLKTIMDQWGYGAGGNYGYEYLPGENVIRNFNSDYAGAVIYEFYMTVDDNYELVNAFDEDLSIRYVTDTNGNGWIDDDDEYSDEPAYYYGETEISEWEYGNYQIPGDYEEITGNLSAAEILAQLGY